MLFNAEAACDQDWPMWRDFVSFHVQADGRVVDYDSDAITTSEGQSYAMFFALASGDRVQFEQLLIWTVNNLAKGDLRKNLPAWKWGRDKKGKWGILDTNSASDSDLWIAYTLLQAARIWKEPQYRQLGLSMLQNIEIQEVIEIPGLGAMLIPGPKGYSLGFETWRLNPSYLPIQLLRYFSNLEGHERWAEIARNTNDMILTKRDSGLIPDWMLYQARKGFYPDKKMGKYSSYDSIRVYLWWAMLDQRDPYFQSIGSVLRKARHYSKDAVLPEKIDVEKGGAVGYASPGFVAVITAYQAVMFSKSYEVAERLDSKLGYYNQVLSLFSYGWLENRFRFDLGGNLTLFQCASE
jgi:endoglucanase